MRKVKVEITARQIKRLFRSGVRVQNAVAENFVLKNKYTAFAPLGINFYNNNYLDWMACDAAGFLLDVPYRTSMSAHTLAKYEILFFNRQR